MFFDIFSVETVIELEAYLSAIMSVFSGYVNHKERTSNYIN